MGDALTELDQLRKKDPSFNASQVDGMYYTRSATTAWNLITKQGNLEGGVYELDLASRFAPLDHDAKSLYDGAELYIDAASFWQVDWATAANELARLYRLSGDVDARCPPPSVIKSQPSVTAINYLLRVGFVMLSNNIKRHKDWNMDPTASRNFTRHTLNAIRQLLCPLHRCACVTP